MTYFLCGFATATFMWAIVYSWFQRVPDESKLWPDVKTDPDDYARYTSGPGAEESEIRIIQNTKLEEQHNE